MRVRTSDNLIRIAKIARRAATLDERLRARSSPIALDAAPWQAQWSRALGSPDALAQRLRWDGIHESRLITLAPPDETNAEWSATLTEALDAGGEPDIASVLADNAASIPFAHVWLGFVMTARRRIGDPPRELLTLAGLLERQLLDHISRLSASVMVQAFDAARSAGSDYASFVERMRSGGLLEVFEEWPVLARQICRVVETFSETAGELLARLGRDEQDLAETFGGGRPLGPPVGFRGALSDRHDGGRQVAAVTFESGATVVYKPGDQHLFVAYQEIIESLRGAAECDAFPPTLRLLARPDYAWVECARPYATDDEGEARRYFRRAGGLLAFAWMLNGRDLHMENVIATRKGPVLVDAEALVQPSMRGASEPATAMAIARRRVADSPLESGLLSFPQVDRDGSVYDIGGLSGRGSEAGSMPTPRWKDVNTDAMTMTLAVEPTTAAENLLEYRGRPALPEAFADDLVRGFSDVCSALLAHRTELHGAVDRLRDCRPRVVLRPTDVYGRALQLLGSAAAQRDGFTASLVVEALYRVFGAAAARPLLWPLAAEEREALLSLDVPRFTIAADSNVLIAKSGEEIRGLFDRSGLDVVRSRIDALSAEAIAAQAALTRTFLAEGGAHITGSRSEQPGSIGAEELQSDEALRSALAIADEIARQAVRGSDGSATWIAPEFLRVSDRDDFGVACSFYSGAAGIAPLFAALADDRSDLRELAYGTLAPLRLLVRDRRRDALLSRERIGAAHGIASMMFGLVAAARLLRDPSLLEDALLLSATLTDERIAADRDLDVEGGAAGAALVLAALFGETGEQRVRGRMLACARHLLARSETPNGMRSWRGADGEARAGFAHGASGMAASLCVAGTVAESDELLAAAGEGFAFEASIYSAALRNWPVMAADERGTLVPVDMTAWCHGAPGVALGRLASLRLRDDTRLRTEAEVALQTTIDRGRAGLDHICCGTFGRVDVLLTASAILDRPAYAAAGRRIARAAVPRSRDNKDPAAGFRLDDSPSSSSPFRPGFFRGLAGIGYTLMRIARPELPSLIGFW